MCVFPKVTLHCSDVHLSIYISDNGGKVRAGPLRELRPWFLHSLVKFNTYIFVSLIFFCDELPVYLDNAGPPGAGALRRQAQPHQEHPRQVQPGKPF